MKVLDLRGLSCPQPVVITRKELREGEQEMDILVDDEVVVENVTRMARSLGCEVKSTRRDGDFLLEVRASGAPISAAEAPAVTFIISADVVGRGEPELGATLMKMFLNALADSENPPSRLLIMNTGVKLVAEGADSVSALRNLECMGTQILVCGTCLDYFKLKDSVAVGTVGNMQEIAEAMTAAANTITL